MLLTCRVVCYSSSQNLRVMQRHPRFVSNYGVK